MSDTYRYYDLTTGEYNNWLHNPNEKEFILLEVRKQGYDLIKFGGEILWESPKYKRNKGKRHGKN